MIHGFDGTCTKPVSGCPECMRAWLDRPPPPGSWRDFTDGDGNGAPVTKTGTGSTIGTDQRSWEEFELARALDPNAEAGHA